MTPCFQVDEAIASYLADPNALLEVWARKYIDDNKGFGAFASKVIPDGRVIAEYLGQKIPVAEADRREAVYHAQGLPHTMIDLSGTYTIYFLCQCSVLIIYLLHLLFILYSLFSSSDKSTHGCLGCTWPHSLHMT